MAAARPLRDWHLPPGLGWTPQRDVTVFGHDGPPLLVDPWEVLEAPGGPVGVAVLTTPPADVAAADTPDRHRPTLLVERRALAVTAGRARTRLAQPPPAEPGQPVLPRHRVVGSPHGPVTLLSTRPWGGRTGPDVRVVAVVVPSGSADALVLTLTWDDEHGLDVLESLAERLVAGLEVELGPARAPGTSRSGRSPGASRAGAARADRSFGQPFPPPGWVGTRAGGTWERAATRLTAVARRLFGPRRFRRATVTAWVAVALLVGVIAAGWDGVGVVLILAAFALCLAMPALLVWRAWTVAHGLVTDPAHYDPSQLPGTARSRGLVAYLVAAAALGGLVLATALDGAPWWYVAAGWYYLAAHVVLVVLETGLGLAPAVRDRLARRGR
ncbi:hypothetical protein [Georgenia subflava]|uniref:Uncharacterized protein n=1 Tax=Georgenia subflava TaxID=1622177 RepID=A0A6N7EIQ4_9MICO|nr:hypothetical protein [Georgenia subflava]MPV37960.1 hypothetical protein [Georgenia subflava]